MGQLRSSPFAYASGFQALFYKEVKRFWRVSFQTVAAPVLTAILYLMIFGHVLEDHVKVYGAISYTSFLIPGLVMMSLLQNSFANTSSSLIQSKITGNLIFVLLAPLSHLEFFMAYVLAAMVRGLVVGLGVFLATCWFTDISFQMPLWILVFGLLSAAVLGALGLIAGIWAEKFDQLAAFQNFFIMPATMLSGVFYSIHTLPTIWQSISHFNPFFYMIDGFRYGFFGVSDVSPWFSLAIVGSFFLLVAIVAIRLLATGYKLRH
ncbi:MAG: ABC transporter permease [Polynucleobacter victoriensis]|uniref:Transport permease protein n=1 Tax=Polynucleobacter victoriensis TaxID=2049319 RepID=A0A212TAU9_9BURK|nr:ABC transporter permease [Polynucleobacter victoriensis]SNC63125.1 ABC-2 type transport system permease protein [Polynucleobacter victoriensis]